MVGSGDLGDQSARHWHARSEAICRPAYSDNGKGFPSFKRIKRGAPARPVRRDDRWRPVGISLRLVRNTRMTVALLDDYATSRRIAGHARTRTAAHARRTTAIDALGLAVARTLPASCAACLRRRRHLVGPNASSDKLRAGRDLRPAKWGSGSVCIAAILICECALWVRSRHCRISARCPLYPQMRTWFRTIVMSALCQKQTLNVVSHQPYPEPLRGRHDPWAHLTGSHQQFTHLRSNAR